MTLRKERRWVLFLLLTLLWVAFIFSNSLKGPEQSGAESGRITAIVEPIVEPIVEAIAGEDAVDVHFLVRKCGHVLEFCFLGLFLLGFLRSFPPCRNGGGAYGPLAALFVGVIDEYIQSFTGRGSQVQDVLIDFGGALLGFAIGIAAIRLSRRRRAAKTVPSSAAEP